MYLQMFAGTFEGHAQTVWLEPGSQLHTLDTGYGNLTSPTSLCSCEVHMAYRK